MARRFELVWQGVRKHERTAGIDPETIRECREPLQEIARTEPARFFAHCKKNQVLHLRTALPWWAEFLQGLDAWDRAVLILQAQDHGIDAH